jgi:hypothetical protein
VFFVNYAYLLAFRASLPLLESIQSCS